MRIDPRVFRSLALALPFALVAFAAAYWWRGYDLLLAGITGLAIGGLAFATVRTVDRMRDLYG